MGTVQKIEYLSKIQKIIFVVTIGLLIIDIFYSIINSAYQSSLVPISTLGFVTYHLLGEYLRSQIKKKKITKGILVIYLVISGFSIYYIILNIVKI